MSAAGFRELNALWEARGRSDEYFGTLVNNYLERGGHALGVKAGKSYVDVGTLHGYRTAMTLLLSRQDARAVPTMPQRLLQSAGFWGPSVWNRSVCERRQCHGPRPKCACIRRKCDRHRKCRSGYGVRSHGHGAKFASDGRQFFGLWNRERGKRYFVDRYRPGSRSKREFRYCRRQRQYRKRSAFLRLRSGCHGQRRSQHSGRQ